MDVPHILTFAFAAAAFSSAGDFNLVLLDQLLENKALKMIW